MNAPFFSGYAVQTEDGIEAFLQKPLVAKSLAPPSLADAGPPPPTMRAVSPAACRCCHSFMDGAPPSSVLHHHYFKVG